MNVQVVALLIGAALLAIGLFGEHVRIKDMGVSRVSVPVRVLAAIIGCLFIAQGFGVLNEAFSRLKRNESRKEVKPSPSPTSLPVTQADHQKPEPIKKADPDDSAQTILGVSPPAPRLESIEQTAADPTERSIAISSYLSEHQIYENSRIYINGLLVLTFALDQAEKHQEFNIVIKAGDSYSISGTTGFAWTRNGERIEVNHKLQGAGVFSNDSSQTDYEIGVRRSFTDVVSVELREK